MRFSTAAVFVAAATLGGSVVSAIPVPNEETALAQLEARETALLIDSILEARGYMDGEVDKRFFRDLLNKVKSAVGLGGSQAQPPADPSAPVARSLDADLVERDEEVSAPTPPASHPKHNKKGGKGRGNRRNRKHRKTQNRENNRKYGKNNRKNRKQPSETDDAPAGGAPPAAPPAEGAPAPTTPAPDASTPAPTARELEEFIEILRRAGDAPQRSPSQRKAERRRRERALRQAAVRNTVAGKVGVPCNTVGASC